MTGSGTAAEGGEPMREYVVDVSEAATLDEFAAAFNEGFCRHLGGHWRAGNWNAFDDYLSWPPGRYRLVFRGWRQCRGLRGEDRRTVLAILKEKDNAHVEAVFE